MLRHRPELEHAVRGSAVTAWAPNCATFSEARGIPIPGVAKQPVVLRSATMPTGIPDPGRSKSLQKRIDDDTEMADLAAVECAAAHRDSRLFLLEHPEKSIARHLPSWTSLVALPGVFVLVYTLCLFPPCSRRKRQCVITNSVGVKTFLTLGLNSRICAGTRSNGNLCDRTGLPHESFDPVVADGRVVSWSTSHESEYPVGFCDVLASGIVSDLLTRPDLLARCPTSFLEVFSGPNAPLTRAVSEKLASHFPHCVAPSLDEPTAPRPSLCEADSLAPSQAGVLGDWTLTRDRELGFTLSDCDTVWQPLCPPPALGLPGPP